MLITIDTSRSLVDGGGQLDERPLFSFRDRSGGGAERLSGRDLDRRARAIARHLYELGLCGERALLLYPPGLEFICALLGCFYGGVTAVPAALARDAAREGGPLHAIGRDAQARAVLTLRRSAKRVREFAGGIALDPPLRVVVSDEIEPEGTHRAWTPRGSSDVPAFLQYTSGSTGSPKGVVVSHANVMHNVAQIVERMQMSTDDRIASWLPFHHDMGLIGNVLLPIATGLPTWLMSPIAAAASPLRWLQMISEQRCTISGGPTFMYELCTKKIDPDRIRELDLRPWRVAYCGAEPVHAATLRAFAHTFAACGFESRALLPCYGLAEATLMVTARTRGHGARTLELDGTALERGRVLPASRGSTRMREVVSCGSAGMRTEVVVRDPVTGAPSPPGRVGEICVRGPSVTSGYFGRPQRSADELLQTGDLGFLERGELFVTGRSKEVVIVRGRNYYPDAIEASARSAARSLEGALAAAFSASRPTAEETSEVGVVVAVELPRARADDPRSCAALRDAVRARVRGDHGIDLLDVVFVSAREIPRTTSGKIRRDACRSRYARGLLGDGAASTANPAARERETCR